MRLSRHSDRAFACLLVLPILAESAHAGGARILRPSGGAEFSQISTAVQAALPGDVIVVGEGDYDGFTLEGKAVSIVGAPGASVRIVHPVVVRDIPAGQVVLFDSLHFAPDITYPLSPLQSSDVPALWVSDCAAPLRIQDCRFDTSFQHPGCVGAISIEPSRRDSPLRLDRCPDAAVVASELITGEAGIAGFDWGYCTGADGAPGARVSESKVAFHSCSITGGKGGKATVIPPPGDGGPGIDASSSFVLLVGSTSTGGLSYGGPTMAGSAVRLDGSSTLALLDSVLVPGGSAPPIGGSGSVLDLPDATRSLAAPSVAAGSSILQVEAAGVAQDVVWTAVAQGGGFRFATSLAGAWLTKFPSKVLFAPNGAIGAAGTLLFQIPVADPVGIARLVDLQSITASSGDGTVVTNARVVLALSRTLGPDCNGNGTSDYVDVLLGGEPDANHDLVPDACQGPPPKTVYVDAAAAPGGDGTPGAPFSNMAQASGAVVDGDTILVADGIYVGAANREFDFDGRRLVVASLNGPDACVFDLEGKGRGFVAKGDGSASSGAARIEGLTLRRPFAGWSPYPQASVVALGLELEIVGCRFDVGAIPIWAIPTPAPLTVRATEFVGCDAGLLIESPATFEDCRFSGIATAGIYDKDGLYPLRVSRTWFVGNDGGVYAETSPSGPLTVENCLFQGNHGQTGGLGTGGIAILGGNAWIDACTFVANHIPAQGGGLFLKGPTTGPVLLSNSILRDNTCGGSCGDQIAIQGNNTHKLTIVHSSVQGGKLGICGWAWVSVWGAGNQTSNPLFVDPDGPDDDPQTLDDNDYHLSAASPCIDAGDNWLAFGLLDLEGLPRFIDDPNVPDTGVGSPPLCDMGCFEKP